MSTQTGEKVELDIDLGKDPVCSCCKKPPVTWKVICVCPSCGPQEELSCQKCKDGVDRIAAKHGKLDGDKIWTVTVRCKACRGVATLRWERV